MSTEELAKVSIIRTTDAQKMELHLTLEATTLAQLKELIASSAFTAEGEQIRVFHLGRELKSGGRSLETLGIGRFRNYTIHVHITHRKKTQQALVHTRTQAMVAAASLKQQQSVVDLLHESDEDVARQPRSKRRRMKK